MSDEYTGRGRASLIEALRTARAELAASRVENEALRAQNQDLRMSLNIKGWFCPSCKIFNGECKEELVICRGCHHPKRGVAADLDELSCACSDFSWCAHCRARATVPDA